MMHRTCSVVLLFVVVLVGRSLALLQTKTCAASSRKIFFQKIGSFVALPLVSIAPSAYADPEQRLMLTDEQIKEIVTSDVVDRQFLVTGDVTTSIFTPSATFTDEIDTYAMEKWIQGTKKLFVGEKSNVRLVGDVRVSPEAIEFRFDEDLMFRIPFRPTVSLSGKVVLTRDSTGYITSYREFWDQDVASVLKTAKF